MVEGAPASVSRTATSGERMPSPASMKTTASSTCTTGLTAVSIATQTLDLRRSIPRNADCPSPEAPRQPGVVPQPRPLLDERRLSALVEPVCDDEPLDLGRAFPDAID